MPRMCSVCSHADRDAIEDALSRGASLRTVAGRHGLSPPALLRHKLHQRAPVAGGEEASEVEEPLADSTAGEETAHMTTKQADPVAAARAEVERRDTEVQRLRDDESSMTERREQVAAELQAKREAVGRAALEAHRSGGRHGAAAAGLRPLEDELNELDAGLAALRPARVTAIKARTAAQAALERAEAAVVGAALAAHVAARDGLLEQIRQLEETRHAPVLTWDISHGPYGSPIEAHAHRPLSDRLAEAKRLHEQAAASLEGHRNPVDAGHTSANDVAGLIERTSSPLHVAPAAAAIKAWAPGALAAARIRPDEPVLYSITWAAGKLDPAQSGVRRT